jgi:transcriptional regulator with XRE-family HTH domain
MNKFAQKLRDFRKLHRIQGQELAQASQLSQSLVSRLEGGWTPITKDLAQQLLDGYRKFDVDASWITQHVKETNHEKN